MKKRLIYLLIFFSLIPTLTIAQSINFNIKGKVGNYSAPYKAYLGFYRKGWKVDSCSIINGEFELSDSVRFPEIGHLYIKMQGSSIHSMEPGYKEIYLESGTVNIIGRESLTSAAIVGGIFNSDLKKLRKAEAEIGMQRKDIFASLKDSVKTSDSLNVLNKVNWRKFIQEHPVSFVSFDALDQLIGKFKTREDILAASQLFATLSSDLQESNLGRIEKMIIDQEMLRGIGTTAPDFEQKSTDGKLVSLHDYKGKYLFVDFWASWCEPCRAENPNVVNAYNKYAGKGFNVLSVSLDNSRENWLSAVREDNLKWTQVSDLKGGENAVARLFFIEGIPANILIDPNGKVIAKNLMGNELDTLLSKLFSKG